MNTARIKAIAVSLIAAASTTACVAPVAHYDRRPVSPSYQSAPYYGNAYSTPLYSSFGITYDNHGGSYSDRHSGGHRGYGHSGGGHGSGHSNGHH